jgi:ABC-2 type transport system ATP-binding protein
MVQTLVPAAPDTPEIAPAASTAQPTPQPSHTAPIVEVRDLTRKFGTFTAVKAINFEVYDREIFGFLGPNGAGKSTTIKMMCTLLAPTSGQVSVAGHDVMRESDAVRSAIGIVFQDNSLDSGLTALENLEFHCMVYHIPRQERAERIKRVLSLMELEPFKDRIVKTYSGGMRRRLEIGRGLLHEPRLLVLDEPTVGLDPQTRNYIWQYVRNLRKEHDTTVFMTTHYMDEAEYCDRIAIIDKGEIVALDTTANLKRMVGADQITLQTRDNDAVLRLIQAKFGVEGQVEDGHVWMSVPEADTFVPRLLAELTQPGSNISVASLNVKRPTVEDVFIKLTGRKIREEEGDKDERKLNLRRLNRI